MVTFQCYNCSETLKKKQTDKHFKCGPKAFICIDCHKTFYDPEYKGHTSCLSEQQKHWGEYAHKKPNQIKTQVQQSIEIKGGQKQQHTKSEGQEKVEVEEWKGWKKQMSRLIKQKKKIQVNELRQLTIKRFRECHQQDGQQEDLFKDKLSKLKRVKLVTYAVYE